MNILKRKGPRRLWIVSTVVWIMCTFILRDYSFEVNCHPLVKPPAPMTGNFKYCIDEVVVFWWFMAFFVPIAILIAFGLYGWIKRGFTEDE